MNQQQQQQQKKNVPQKNGIKLNQASSESPTISMYANVIVVMWEIVKVKKKTLKMTPQHGLQHRHKFKQNQ